VGAKPKSALSPEQRAQRLFVTAQSALRQNLFDEALDLLQQAQSIMPNNADVKNLLKQVMSEFTKGVKVAKKPVAAPEPMPAMASAESAADMEKRIRGEAGRDQQAAIDAAVKAALAAQSATNPATPPAGLMEETRRQILASSLSPEEGGLPLGAMPEPTALPPRASRDDAGAEAITETMAELYLSQGHEDEAVRVLTEILRRDPSRADLREKISGIQTRKAFPTAAPPAPVRAAPPPAAPARIRPRVSYV
jgi:tetratricopeptide (TPR) repeat protein